MIKITRQSMLWITSSWLFHFCLAEQQAEATARVVQPAINSPTWAVLSCAVLAGLGVIFNSLSLSYFIRREHASLGSKLLMLLNGLDLMVCVTGVIQLGMMVVYWQIPQLAHETFGSLYFVFLEATGFATCLLSIIQCIRFYVPFYKFKRHFVTLPGLIFVGYTLIREIALTRLVNRDIYVREGLSKIHIGLLVGEVGLMILVTLTVNTISVVRIISQHDEVNRSRTRTAGIHATVTVLILSGIFCFLNTFYLITQVLYFCYSVTFSHNIVLYFGILYAVPLNSVINPLIYLARKREMRRFLGKLFMLGLCEPHTERRFSLRTRTLSLVAMTSIRSSNRSTFMSRSSTMLKEDSSPRLRSRLESAS